MEKRIVDFNCSSCDTDSCQLNAVEICSDCDKCVGRPKFKEIIEDSLIDSNEFDVFDKDAQRNDVD